MKKIFKLSELEKADTQYPVLGIDEFKEGDKVFLKCNPEIELVVVDVDKTINTVYTDKGDFISQQLYKFNGNVIYKNHKLNMN